MPPWEKDNSVRVRQKINATTTEIAAGDNHKIWNTNNAWGEPHKLLAVEHQCFKIQLL